MGQKRVPNDGRIFSGITLTPIKRENPLYAEIRTEWVKFARANNLNARLIPSLVDDGRFVECDGRYLGNDWEEALFVLKVANSVGVAAAQYALEKHRGNTE